MVKGTVSLKEVKGEINLVEGGHDVGRVTAVLKNPDKTASRSTKVTVAFQEKGGYMDVSFVDQKAPKSVVLVCEVDSDCTHAFAKPEASVLIELTIKTARKLMVEPPVTVVWLELTALKLWLVRPVQETECTATDRVSHVKFVLAMSEGKAEKESDCFGSHVKRLLTRMRVAKGTEERVLTNRSVACGAPLPTGNMSAVKLARRAGSVGMRSRRPRHSVPRGWCAGQVKSLPRGKTRRRTRQQVRSGVGKDTL